MRDVVLWGHHIDEYQRMFGLTDVNWDSKILEYGSGATAVNSELHARHQSLVSVDTWFALDRDTLDKKVNLMFDEAVRHLLEVPEQYDFQSYGSVDALIEKRRAGVVQFLADYEKGRIEKRYVQAQQDGLPFENFCFDLALSAHCYFSGVLDQDADFHIQSIRELLRVAKEVRIFPLIDREGQPSTLLGPVLLALQQSNYGVELREVDAHLHPGGHAMLRVWARECRV